LCVAPAAFLVVPYDPTRVGTEEIFGASLERRVRLGAPKGYRIVGSVLPA